MEFESWKTKSNVVNSKKKRKRLMLSFSEVNWRKYWGSYFKLCYFSIMTQSVTCHGDKSSPRLFQMNYKSRGHKIFCQDPPPKSRDHKDTEIVNIWDTFRAHLLEFFEAWFWSESKAIFLSNSSGIQELCCNKIVGII